MATRLTDTFTDANLVKLDVHVGELGATWTALAGMAGVNKPSIFDNRLFGFDATNSIYLASGTATTDGESITASVQKFDATSCAIGPAIRGSLVTNSCYNVFWAPDGTLALYRVISSTMTQIATGTAAISNGTHTVKLQATGTGASVLLEVFIDGAGSPALSFSDTDAARLTTPGKFGVYLAGATGGSAGIHFNDVNAIDAAAAAPTFTYTAPLNKTIHQRTAGAGTVKVSGTYTGAPATIEARLVAAGTNTPVSGFDWSPKVASPSGSAFSFTFASVPESLAWREVQVRDSANPGTVFTSGKVAVGALFASVNQSNVANFCYVGSSTLTANDSTSVFGRVGTWQAPNPSTMDGAITFLNSMVTALGVACGWLDTAKSGTSLDAGGFEPWLPTASSATYAYFRDTVTALDGTVEGVVSAAGENDANEGVSQATFYADLGLLFSAIRADTGKPNLPIVMMTLGRVLIGGYATDAQAQAIRLAQEQKAADANIYRVDCIDVPLGGDNIHSTAAGYVTRANRAALAMKAAFGLASQYRGPSYSSVQIVSSTVYDVVLTHHSGSDFTPSSGITGFRVLDGGTPVTISSAVRQAADRVRLTLAAAPASSPTVQYLYGVAPTVTSPVRDNSALALPMEYNGGVTSTASTVTSVTVAPSTANVAGSGTQQFNATVNGTGSPSQSVTWMASAGSINGSGLFTAPAATGSVQNITITATSTQDNTKSGTAAVTVPAGPVSRSVSITLRDVSGVLASLTGLRVAFYEETSPATITTPIYQSGTETTDAGGVLQFNCTTLLPSGGTGYVIVQHPDGRHFNGTAAVA